MTVRIIVADDHPVVRTGLVMMLGGDSGIEVLAEASNGQEAITLAIDHSPDVVVMDLQMPKVDGVEATRQIKADNPDIAVLILTTYDNDRSIVAAVNAGATGYLLKDAPPRDLVSAIKDAAAGSQALTPAIAAKLEAHRTKPAIEELTSRETDVLRALVGGGTNRSIAEQLFVSQATVKTHLIHIFQKLQVEDRTSAVAKAIELGIVEV